MYYLVVSNSNTLLPFFFCFCFVVKKQKFFLYHQVTEAQIEAASAAQSPGSQLSLAPGIKCSYDSGAISLAASEPNPSEWGLLSVIMDVRLYFFLLCFSGHPSVPHFSSSFLRCLFQAVSVGLEPQKGIGAQHNLTEPHWAQPQMIFAWIIYKKSYSTQRETNIWAEN